MGGGAGGNQYRPSYSGKGSKPPGYKAPKSPTDATPHAPIGTGTRAPRDYRPPGDYSGGYSSTGRPVPGNNGQDQFTPLGYDPNRAGDPFGIGSYQSDPDNAVKQFNYLSKQAAAELAKGNYDENQFNDYYAQASAPIESDFYKQAGSTASYLARQGLGSSGINVAASADLSQNKAALEGQAKLKSLDLAKEAHRREILDAFSTSAMGLQPVLQNKGIDVGLETARLQYQAMLKQLSAQESAGLGNLFGTVGGAALLALLLA